MMYPGEDYSFRGKSVTEYPMMQGGGRYISESVQPQLSKNYTGTFLPINRDPYGNARKKLFDNENRNPSTESVMGINDNSGYYNIPTVVNGVRFSDDDAVNNFYDNGMYHTGYFNTQEEADRSADYRERANIGLSSTGLYKYGGEVNFTYAGENHRVYEKESPTGNGKGIEGHIMVNHPTKNKGKWDTIDLTKITNGKVKTVAQGVASTKKWHKENPEYADGGMIKRADGSYSKRGLWDNIRDNAGSGKKPTKEMLKQERKIKSQYANGGKVSNWEIIEDLPKAGNGLINSLMATLNPKNQGVRDYTKSGTRDQAYAAARKAGVKEFMWNNERFSTDMAGTPAQQLKWSGITNSQTENRSFFTPVNFAKDRLRKNLVPYGYTNPAGRVYDAIVKDKSTPYVSEDKHIVLGLKDVSPERRDAFKLYMNNPQENNTFGISNYTPSLKDKNSNSNNGPYYKINNLYGDPTKSDNDVNFFYELNKNRVTNAALPNLIKTPFDNLTKAPPTLINFQNDIMGHYKTSIGSDERGNYMSYYDKWDLNPKKVKNPITGKEIPTDIGKPFEIYDRVYFKDYGDGEEKRMYYTDKELKSFNTDKNTKNFDTIALQKELYNRGYKLPNSVKVVEGSRLKFDGILGDETKKALQDFQNKKVEAPKMAVQKPGQSEALPPQFKKGGKTKKSNWQIIEY